MPSGDDVVGEAEASRPIDRVVDENVDNSITRPSSAKFGNASRQRHSSSQSLSSAEQVARMSPSGITENQNHDDRATPKPTTPGLPHVIPPPDMERLDADLMVFQMGSADRPKRDSLVCHPDEDDFVVLRKDASGRNRLGTLDGRPGHSSARNSPNPNNMSKEGSKGTRSRNKSLSKSATHSPEINDRKFVRPESRGRHRSKSTTTPEGLLTEESYSHLASGAVSSLGLYEARNTTSETTRHTRHRSKSTASRTTTSTRSSSKKASHDRKPSGAISSPRLDELVTDTGRRNSNQSDGQSSTASSAARRFRHDPMPPASNLTRYKSPELLAEHKVALPIKLAKHQRENSYSGTMPSPEAVKSNASPRASPETRSTAPKVFRERIPPTPKPMVLPPDYDSATAHQSIPTPPKKQPRVPTSKFIDRSIDEKRRSAVF